MLEELYQEIILDHYRRPRNRGRIDPSDLQAHDSNPLCGDEITVTAKLSDGKIADIKFDGHGCSISTASASIMTETLKGRTLPQADSLFETFHTLVTGPKDPGHAGMHQGKLAVFAGVSEFPTRVKCAILCWHTLRAALEGNEEAVTTE